MATQRQAKAAELVVKNLGNPRATRTMSDILQDAGYTKAVAKTPQIVTESQGFKDQLAAFGLTEELVATELVGEITHGRRGRKVPALALAAKVLGMENGGKGEDDKGEVDPITLILNQYNIKDGNKLNVDTSRVVAADTTAERQPLQESA